MPRVFPMGHRRRGAGLTTDSLYPIAVAYVLAQFANQTFYVNSGAAAGGAGTSWTDALTTLQAAINLALPGDTILVAQGHTEACIAAGTITVNKAGLTIVGMGNGRRRPTITFTTSTAATFAITAANVTIQNLCFDMTGLDAVVSPITVTGSDCTFIGCEFETGNATNQCLVGILITGTNRFGFFDNFVHGTIDAGTTNFIQIVGAASVNDGHQFVGNVMMGAYTTTLGCVNNITTACTNVVITDNVMVNKTAAATKTCVFLTGSTGIVARNQCGIGSGAAPFSIDAGHWAGNHSAAAVATNGTLV